MPYKYNPLLPLGLDYYQENTDLDVKVKVSANDTTAGYLNGKLVAGTGITLTEGSDGGDETFTVSNDYAELDSGSAQGQLLFWDNANSKWTYLETSEMFWDDTNKRLGIGTDTPAANFHVETAGGSIGENFRFTHTNTGRLFDFAFYENSTLKATLQTMGSTYSTTDRRNNFEIWNRVNGDITFHTNGNVGIGTYTPSEKLEVSGNVKLLKDNKILLVSEVASSDTSSTKDPTSASDTGSDWANITNIYSSNNNYASATAPVSPSLTSGLRATGFDFSAIPSGSTILGIEVLIEGKVSSSVAFYVPSLYLSYNGNNIGDNKGIELTGDPDTYWWNEEKTLTYGSSTELWGAGLTVAQLKDSSFGVTMYASAYPGFSGTCQIDNIKIKVYYTPTNAYNTEIYSSGASVLSEFNDVKTSEISCSETATYSLNTYLGYRAGINTPSATRRNVGIGYRAGANQITTSDSNIFIGFEAGYGNSDTTDSVAVGYQALSGASGTNNNNVALGKGAGNGLIGRSNLLIGADAGRGAEGDYNMFFSYASGYDSEGDYNIGIGYLAGRDSVADYCIYLGDNAGNGNTTDNQLIIKQNAVNATPLIQGDFSTGNVGIGLTTPTETLDVNGTIKGTGYKSSDGSAGVTGSFVDNGGNTITVKNGLITDLGV
jgi:hypothetical protein